MWIGGSESAHLQFFLYCFMVLALGAGACHALLLWRSDGRFSKPARLLIWVLGIGAVLAAIGFYFPFTNDDSFILFRYAENAASGRGWVFNPGERIEGYTSPLWLAVAVLGRLIGFDPALFAKAAGAAMGIVCLFLFGLASRRVVGSALGTWMTVFMLAFSQLFLSWSGCGMDTMVFLAFSSAVIYLHTLPRIPFLPLLLLTAIGGFVRPEAYLLLLFLWWRFFVPKMPGLFIDEPQTSFDDGRRRMVGLAARDFALFGAAALPFIVRHLYYGTWLPNTFYAKSDRSLAMGWQYLVDSASCLEWTLVAVGTAGVLLQLRRRWWLAANLGAILGYLLFVGGDVLSQRFILFAVPWLMLGAGLMAEQLLEQKAGRLLVGLFFVALVGRSIAQMNAVRYEYGSQEGHFYVPNNSRGTAEADYFAGLYIADHANPGDLLATDNIGAVSYYAGVRVLDTCGLTDGRVADLIWNRQESKIAELVERSHPRWILCNISPQAQGENWTLLGAGNITPWASPLYRPVERYTAVTGYQRLLLERISSREQKLSELPSPARRSKPSGPEIRSGSAS